MNKKRVIMLMSGGVDSSVSAALLKQQNYDVIGVYILGWTGTNEFPCSWQTEEADARAVAEKLEIPFHTVNVSKEYEHAVIDQFFAGYQAGVTPNPDILCNQEIKFKAVWQAVRQFEPDYLATGHYARMGKIPIPKSQYPSKLKILKANDQKIENSEIGNLFKIRNSKFKINSHPAIFKARDENKDQTYFLWGINKEILPHVLFPLGDLTKPEVRVLAKKFGLATATKKDSQGICFVGPLKVREFLASRVRTKPGDVYLADGRKIATHDGVELYTIGQRLGAGMVSWTGDVPPLFVIAKDITRNRLIVGPDAATFATEFTAGQLNWLVSTPINVVKKAKVRYRQKDITVSVRQNSDGLLVTTNEPVRAITPGQSAVFYSEDDQLLGGGVIERVQEMQKIIDDTNQNIQSAKAAAH